MRHRYGPGRAIAEHDAVAARQPDLPLNHLSVADYWLATGGVDTISDPTSHLTAECLRVTLWSLQAVAPNGRSRSTVAMPVRYQALVYVRLCCVRLWPYTEVRESPLL